MDRRVMPHILNTFVVVGTVSWSLLGVHDTVRSVYAQQAMMKAPAFQRVLTSDYGFDDTVAMLKGAIEGENLMVIKEINPQKMLRMVGVKTKGMKQVFFFHPRFMKRIMDTNAQASIEPPLKIAVMETPKDTVVVKYIKPSYLLGRYEGLEAIGSELDALVAKIVASVQQ